MAIFNPGVRYGSMPAMNTAVVYLKSTAAISRGYAVCWNMDWTGSGTGEAATDFAQQRANYVIPAAAGNLWNFAGVMTHDSAAADATDGVGRWVRIALPGSFVEVYTDQSCTLNTTLLALAAGGTFKGIGSGPIVGRALQTVDRSSTNGLVGCYLFDSKMHLQAPYGGNTDAGPSTGVWETCPWREMQQDPTLGYSFFDDFTCCLRDATDSHQGGYSSYIDTGNTIAQPTAVTDIGGILSMATDASDNDGPVLQANGATCVITTSTGKNLWFEARVRFGATLTEFATFIGLAAPGRAADAGAGDGTGMINDNPDTNIAGVIGNTTATRNCIGFANFTNAAPVWTPCYNKFNGGTAVSGDASHTIVASTWTKLGIKFDVAADTPSFYVNGSKICTDIDVSAAGSTNFPANLLLSPVLAAKNGSAGARNIDIDWWRLAQLR